MITEFIECAGLVGLLYMFRYPIMNFTLDRYVDIKYKLLPNLADRLGLTNIQNPVSSLTKYRLAIEHLPDNITYDGQSTWSDSDAKIKIKNNSHIPINIPYYWNDTKYVYHLDSYDTIYMPIYTHDDLLSSPDFDIESSVIDNFGNSVHVTEDIKTYAGPKGNFYIDLDTTPEFMIPEFIGKRHSILIKDMFGKQQILLLK